MYGSRSCGADDGVEDEVEAAGVLLHLGRVARDDHLVGAERMRVGDLARRGGEQRRSRAPSACANFTPMWPSPPRPTMPTFLPGRRFQWRSGE